MVHRSKKDLWLVSLVWASVLVPLVFGVYNITAPGGNPHAGRTLIFVATFTCALFLWLTYPLYYEIPPSHLIVRCGILVRKKIALASIEGVRPTRNPLSAPAWSLDRLQVSYRNGGGITLVLISPEDKMQFMRELCDAGVGLEMRGGRVVRGS